jgi:glutathione peroxidase-family protein
MLAPVSVQTREKYRWCGQQLSIVDFPAAAGWGRKTQAVSRIRRFCRTSYKSQVSANLAD